MTQIYVAPSGDYSLTTGAVARHIGGTSQHVRQLIKSGRLKAIDIASGAARPRFRISKADLDAFLAVAAVGPPALSTQEVA